MTSDKGKENANTEVMSIIIEMTDVALSVIQELPQDATKEQFQDAYVRAIATKLIELRQRYGLSVDKIENGGVYNDK